MTAKVRQRGASFKNYLTSKSLWYYLGFAGLLLILGILISSIFVYYKYIFQLEKASGYQVEVLASKAYQSWIQVRNQPVEPVTMLVLGVDEVANRQGDPLLTDTIILAKIYPSSSQINLVSLPRDLWNQPYRTKINALYQYGVERQEPPGQFPEMVIEEMTGVEIDRVVVLNLELVGELIDAVGGIEVNVEQGFVDEQFPRVDVDIRTVTDPALLYETIVFESGTQEMSGSRALKYIRSRKSSDLSQGTDLARATRQQQVIMALADKMTAFQTLSDPEIVGELASIYQTNFEHIFPIDELINWGVAMAVSDKDLTINSGQLSVEDDESEMPVFALTNPPVSKYNQWVYEIADEVQFKYEIQNTLNDQDTSSLNQVQGRLR